MKKKYRNLLIILLALAMIFLYAGGRNYYAVTLTTGRFEYIFMTLQNCLEALLFNPILPIQAIVENVDYINILTVFGYIIFGAYCVAIVAAPLINILIVFSVFDFFRRLFVNYTFKKDRILIIGYNADVRQLIEKHSKTGKLYLWTEEFLSSDEERFLYLNKVSVAMHDFSLSDNDNTKENEKNLKTLNRFLERKNISYVLLLDSSDVKNASYYMTLSDLDECRKRTIHFFVLCRSFEIRNMLQDYYDSKIENSASEENYTDIRIFNYEQIQAERLFSKLPVYGDCESLNEKRKGGAEQLNVHMLIMGANRLSYYILLHAMNQAVISQDGYIVIDVVDKDVSGFSSNLQKRFKTDLVKYADDNTFVIDDLDGKLMIRLHECDLASEKIGACMNVVSSIPDNLTSGTDQWITFKYAVFCINNADENLRLLSELDHNNNSFFAEGEQIPVAIGIPYSDGMNSYITAEDAGRFAWCKKMYFMGEGKEYLSVDDIINPEEEKKIKEYNARYTRISNNLILREVKDADAEKEWNRLFYQKRQSNRALFFHSKVKAELFPESEYEAEMSGFKGDIIYKKGDKEMSRFLVEDQEKKFKKLVSQARTEHRRWTYFYVSEGWDYHEKEQNKRERKHPCICNWETLKIDRSSPDTEANIQNKIEDTSSTLIYDLMSSPVFMKKWFSI